MRFLFLSDSHLGVETPKHPRKEIPRRGDDFLRNFHQALEPAMRGEVEFVLHGGDLFDRSQPPDRVIYEAASALVAVADKGVPVLLVPGNHERSWIPGGILFGHPNLHIFLEPNTLVLTTSAGRVGVSGFSFVRENIRDCFGAQMEATKWAEKEVEWRLLLVHQTFSGAVAGTGNYMFRHGADVIPLSAVPDEFELVTAGHIHRHQVLSDANGRQRVLYPGSTERTAFAELGEAKGYVLGEIDGDGLTWQFIELECRPMLGRDFKDFATFALLKEAVCDWVYALPVGSQARMRIYIPPGWDRSSQNLIKTVYKINKGQETKLSLSVYKEDGKKK